MEIKLNLQFRLLITVALVIVFTLLALTYSSINRQKELSYASFRDLAITLAQALDAGIGSRADLDDTDKLQSNIYKIMWLNPNITIISISLPDGNGLRVVASNDTTLIGEEAISESISSYQKGTILTKILTEPDGTKVLRAVTPVHVGGQRVGTYDIRLSLEALEKVISETQKQFFLGMIIAILVIIGVLFLLIRTTVIDPVKTLQRGMEIIGIGKLDHRIKIRRRDEIGDLASGFNEMAKKLKEKTEALEEKKAGLERRVEQRTRELQKSKEELEERVEELERFRKIIVGRELKMVELKEKIKELEGKIKKISS